ncbi:MAG: Rz1-like lysis system protein LysC [Pseudomonadales bacterium]
MGCSNQYGVEIDKRLTEPCKQPELMGDTWRDVLVLSIEQKAALIECNKRIDIIRGRGVTSDSNP